MDKETIRNIPDQKVISKDIFLSCEIDNTERTFVFNENNHPFMSQWDLRILIMMLDSQRLIFWHLMRIVKKF